uniref:Retrotransposon protein, putative, unclassified n=1 Tax=Oryza sativa subsp. japonica TaxID=39947 RepID=Q2QP21_ORYSJ|nr:retrotransposon protein, putative, unclassified [Oryza sativa Japonica Group]
MGINQPMLLFEDPPQASRNKGRVQASLKPEDYTINLNHLKQYSSNERCHLTPAKRRINVTCYRCGEEGHCALDCPKKKLGNGQVRNIPRHPKRKMRAGIPPKPMPHSLYPKPMYQQFRRQGTTPHWWKGKRKRKASSRITYAELNLSKMGIEIGDLPEDVEELQLWQRKRDGCCFSCGQFGHYAIGCTQDTNEEQETLPSQIGPEKDRVPDPSKEVSKIKACSRCGEIGHYGSNCITQCPYCDEDHPNGECPTTKITCFLCEKTDHVPQDCQLSPLLTKTAEVQRVSLRFAHRLMTSRSHEDPGFPTFDLHVCLSNNI